MIQPTVALAFRWGDDTLELMDEAGGEQWAVIRFGSRLLTLSQEERRRALAAVLDDGHWKAWRPLLRRLA